MKVRRKERGRYPRPESPDEIIQISEKRRVDIELAHEIKPMRKKTPFKGLVKNGDYEGEERMNC